MSDFNPKQPKRTKPARGTEGIEIIFPGDADPPVLAAGEPVDVSVVIDPPAPMKMRKLILELLWQTSGRGDTDSEVASRTVLTEGAELHGRHEFPVRLEVPLAPFSYDGHLIKVRWVARVRVDRALARDRKHEQTVVVV